MHASAQVREHTHTHIHIFNALNGRGNLAFGRSATSNQVECTQMNECLVERLSDNAYTHTGMGRLRQGKLSE